MKNILMLFIFFLFPLLNPIMAQCNYEKLSDSCILELKQYHYLKSKKIEIRSAEDARNAIYAIVFNKGIDYIITACYEQNSDKKMIVVLFDKFDRPIISSFSTNNVYNKIRFNCKSTKTYYLGYFFDSDGKFEGFDNWDEDNTGCGLSKIGYIHP